MGRRLWRESCSGLHAARGLEKEGSRLPKSVVGPGLEHSPGAPHWPHHSGSILPLPLGSLSTPVPRNSLSRGRTKQIVCTGVSCLSVRSAESASREAAGQVSGPGHLRRGWQRGRQEQMGSMVCIVIISPPLSSRLLRGGDFTESEGEDRAPKLLHQIMSSPAAPFGLSRCQCGDAHIPPAVPQKSPD